MQRHHIAFGGIACARIPLGIVVSNAFSLVSTRNRAVLSAYLIRNCCIERIFGYFIRRCVVLLSIERMFAYFIRNCVVLLSIERIFGYFIRNCCIERIFAYFIRNCCVERIFGYF